MKCSYKGYLIVILYIFFVQTVSSQELYSQHDTWIKRYVEWEKSDTVVVILSNGEVCYFLKSNLNLYEEVTSVTTDHFQYEANCIRENSIVEVDKFITNKRLDSLSIR